MKFLLILLIILLSILITLYIFFKIHSICRIFKHKKSSASFANMIREIQLKADCNKKPTIPITKYIYYNKRICGAISNTTLILNGSDTALKVLLEGFIWKEKFYNSHIQYEIKHIYDSILPQIKNYTIHTITGWSLGAQIALCVGIYLNKEQHKMPNIIIYGLPPIGDKQFSTLLNPLKPTIYCYNHPKDPLAYFPFGNNSFSKFIYSIINIYHPVACSNNYEKINHMTNSIFSHYDRLLYHASYF